MITIALKDFTVFMLREKLHKIDLKICIYFLYDKLMVLPRLYQSSKLSEM